MKAKCKLGQISYVDGRTTPIRAIKDQHFFNYIGYVELSRAIRNKTSFLETLQGTLAIIIAIFQLSNIIWPENNVFLLDHIYSILFFIRKQYDFNISVYKNYLKTIFVTRVTLFFRVI